MRTQQIEKLNIIKKEIDIISNEYEDLMVSYSLSSHKDPKDIEKIEKSKHRAVQKLLVLYNQLNEAIDKIDNDTIRVIVRLKLKGWSWKKIGNKIGYSYSGVRKIYENYLKKDNDKKC